MEIKDYLHLYLGCECNVYNLHSDFILDSVGHDRVIVRSKAMTRYVMHHEAKLLLRPLSDMTEEESKEARTMFSKMADDNKAQGEIWADQTRHMLSQAFDLFGLIDAGLAIDKTKIKK